MIVSPFKAKANRLGLSQKDITALFRLKNERTAHHWLSGEREPPHHIHDEMDGLVQVMERHAIFVDDIQRELDLELVVAFASDDWLVNLELNDWLLEESTEKGLYDDVYPLIAKMNNATVLSANHVVGYKVAFLDENNAQLKGATSLYGLYEIVAKLSDLHDKLQSGWMQ